MSCISSSSSFNLALPSQTSDKQSPSRKFGLQELTHILNASSVQDIHQGLSPWHRLTVSLAKTFQGASYTEEVAKEAWKSFHPHGNSVPAAQAFPIFPNARSAYQTIQKPSGQSATQTSWFTSSSHGSSSRNTYALRRSFSDSSLNNNYISGRPATRIAAPIVRLQRMPSSHLQHQMMAPTASINSNYPLPSAPPYEMMPLNENAGYSTRRDLAGSKNAQSFAGPLPPFITKHSAENLEFKHNIIHVLKLIPSAKEQKKFLSLISFELHGDLCQMRLADVPLGTAQRQAWSSKKSQYFGVQCVPSQNQAGAFELHNNEMTHLCALTHTFHSPEQRNTANIAHTLYMQDRQQFSANKKAPSRLFRRNSDLTNQINISRVSLSMSRSAGDMEIPNVPTADISLLQDENFKKLQEYDQLILQHMHETSVNPEHIDLFLGALTKRIRILILEKTEERHILWEKMMDEEFHEEENLLLLLDFLESQKKNSAMVSDFLINTNYVDDGNEMGTPEILDVMTVAQQLIYEILLKKEAEELQTLSA